MSPPARPPQSSLLMRMTWPFVLVACFQALVAVASIWALSTVRAFVAGESLWSKGQKDAVYHLEGYATTGNAQRYQLFLQALDVPLGDRMARLALEQDPPDVEAAFEGIQRGGNHVDDIPGLIWMLRYLHRFDLVRQPVQLWRIGDVYLEQLQVLGEQIHRLHQLETVDDAMRQGWQEQIHRINSDVTPAAKAFSASLGDSSRRIVELLLWLNTSTAGLMVILTLMRVQTLLGQRLRAENTLRAERERARTMLAALGDGVVATDAQGRVLYLNPAAEELLIQLSETATDQPLHEVLRFQTETSADPLQMAGQLPQPVAQPSSGDMLKHLLTRASTLRDSRPRLLQRTNGSVVPVTVVGSPIHHQGVVTGAVMVLHDVTREQHFVQELSWQATHDEVTGLLNRREFERRLGVLLAQPRTLHSEGCVLFMDLDQFKVINDTCGHHAGDDMLREVSRALQSQLRESDTLARLGGDEFGIVLPHCTLEVAQRMAEQMCKQVQQLRMPWRSQHLSTGLSAGLVMLTAELHTTQEAMRVADMACYAAKEAGRNRVFVYRSQDSEMSRREGEMDWVQRLRQALEEDRFVLYAQTIAPLQGTPGDTAPGLHLEILLRLRDESGQLVLPGSFIPAAEQYGMMPSLDRWVIRHTLRALAANAATVSQQPEQTRPVVTCSINLSGLSLGESHFLEFVRNELALHQVPPARVCFEITETTAIAHLPSAMRFINELRQLGCLFSLDDFGVGMSSFGYLKHLPVDYIKIDGSFVKDLLADPTNRAIVEMINHIGHVMGKRTVGEFAESQDIIEALREIGVDYAQGYAITRPQPLENLLTLAPAALDPTSERVLT